MNIDPPGWSLVGIGRARGAAEVSVFEPVGVTAEGHQRNAKLPART
jgi:hypothetical protein